MPTSALMPHPWDDAIATWATERLPQQLPGASARTLRRYVTAVRRLAQLKPLRQPLTKLQEADLIAVGDLIRATPHASMHADLRALRLFLLDALDRGLFGRRWLHLLTAEAIVAALHSQYLPPLRSQGPPPRSHATSCSSHTPRTPAPPPCCCSISSTACPAPPSVPSKPTTFSPKMGALTYGCRCSVRSRCGSAMPPSC